MTNLSMRNILLLLLLLFVSACATNRTPESSPGILSEYTENLAGSERNSANGFIQFLRTQVYKNGELDNFPEVAVILYDARPENILLAMGYKPEQDWVDMDIGFSAPNRMLLVNKTQQWPRFVLNVGLPGAAGVSVQTSELAALGVKKIIHIGTAGLLGDRASDSVILLGESAYKDAAAVMLSTPANKNVSKLVKPETSLANRVQQIGKDRIKPATGYTIPIFYYQPSKLLERLLTIGKFDNGPLIDYMEMEQAPFYQTCQLAEVACVSLVIGSDRTHVKNGKITTEYFNHDLKARKIEALRIAFEAFSD